MLPNSEQNSDFVTFGPLIYTTWVMLSVRVRECVEHCIRKSSIVLLKYFIDLFMSKNFDTFSKSLIVGLYFIFEPFLGMKVSLECKRHG